MQEKVLNKNRIGMLMLIFGIILYAVFVFLAVKGAMVSNLLVVLCGNTEAQPIVNTGSLY